jgi:hypothetical protein
VNEPGHGAYGWGGSSAGIPANTEVSPLPNKLSSYGKVSVKAKTTRARNTHKIKHAIINRINRGKSELKRVSSW